MSQCSFGKIMSYETQEIFNSVDIQLYHNVTQIPDTEIFVILKGTYLYASPLPCHLIFINKVLAT
jgi:hypothetical protein